MLSTFNAEIYTPNLTSLESLSTVLTTLDLFPNRNDLSSALSTLQVQLGSEGDSSMTSGQSRPGMESGATEVGGSGGGGSWGIGIKKLIMIAEMARQDDDRVDKFVSVMLEETLERKISGGRASKFL